MLLMLLLLHKVLLVGPARCFFLFLPTLLPKLHGDACCRTEPSQMFRVRPRYDYEKKHVSRDSKMCCCCCRFCFGCSDDRRKNTRTGALMIHRRLTTAGYEVAPHYHQLLVRWIYHSLLSTQLLRIHASCLLWGARHYFCLLWRVTIFQYIQGILTLYWEVREAASKKRINDIATGFSAVFFIRMLKKKRPLPALRVP